jgi:DNA-binding NarL/FixJ family response regulator
MPPISVAICEDEQEVREGFRYLLNLDPDIRVLGVYSAAEALIAALDEGLIRPEIVLMDIVLPGMSGIDATGYIRERHPAIEVLILTIFEEEAKIMQAIEQGAAGYVVKSTRPGDLVAQIKDVKSGGSPISPHVARKLLSEFRRERVRRPSDEFNLTTREREIVGAIVEGLTYREIADRYNIAASTVKRHILNIYKKLRVNSKVEFMKKVFESDLI